jgi:hypothetical protein
MNELKYKIEAKGRNEMEIKDEDEGRNDNNSAIKDRTENMAYGSLSTIL